MSARTLLNFTLRDIEQIAERKVGIVGWRVYHWRRVDEGTDPLPDSIVLGCVPDGHYTKGPRQGRPRFSRPLPGTKREVIVSAAELIAEAQRYPKETGNCWDCKGTGQVYAGWSKESGTRHRRCPCCQGTGRAQDSSQQAAA